MKPGDVVAERWEVLSLAAEGGMGAVYRARDRSSGRPVALKILRLENADDQKRFEREAGVVARISHPAIVAYVAHGSAAGTPYLVTEWIEGATLAAILQTRGFTVTEAVDIARRLAEALTEVHRLGLVHRDIKPQNVILEGGRLDRLKLIDFGVARPVMTSSSQHGVTRTGMLVGTPGYMSPEQARGEREIDARADVFSLGCVLYECLTGWAPFSGEHSMVRRAKILIFEPPPVHARCPEAPPALEALMSRMLAKAPEMRPSSGEDLAASLARVQAGMGDLGATTRRPTHTQEASTVRNTPVSRAALLVLAGYPDYLDAGTTDSPFPVPSREQIAAAIGPTSGDVVVEQLPGGATICVVRGGPSVDERAGVAARCALAVRALDADVPIAVVVAANPSATEDPIQRAVSVLWRSARKIMFQGGTPGGSPIWIDEAAAELLHDRFPIMADAAGSWLRPGGPP